MECKPSKSTLCLSESCSNIFLCRVAFADEASQVCKFLSIVKSVPVHCDWCIWGGIDAHHLGFGCIYVQPYLLGKFVQSVSFLLHVNVLWLKETPLTCRRKLTD